MQRYPAHFVSQARRLASEGVNYSEIAKRLNISRSQISTWCNGLSEGSHSNTIRTHQKRRRLLLNSESKIFSILSFDKNYAKLFCGILYGCEGSKYPASGGALANADPELVLCFLTLFRKAFSINEGRLRVHLQVHDNQNYKKLISYWSSLLNIPESQFYKPTVTIPHGRKHRDKYLGTCTVKYYDYKLQLKLIGIFEAFMRKSTLVGGVA
jgi:predicted transcriptional regulator